jgi:hypothetical protein
MDEQPRAELLWLQVLMTSTSPRISEWTRKNTSLTVALKANILFTHTLPEWIFKHCTKLFVLKKSAKIYTNITTYVFSITTTLLNKSHFTNSQWSTGPSSAGRNGDWNADDWEIIIITIIIYLNWKWVFTQWQWYYNMTQHTNTHITQNNTQCNKTNKGTMNTFKKNTVIPVTGHGGLWGCEMSRIPRCLDN